MQPLRGLLTSTYSPHNLNIAPCTQLWCNYNSHRCHTRSGLQPIRIAGPQICLPFEIEHDLLLPTVPAPCLGVSRFPHGRWKVSIWTNVKEGTCSEILLLLATPSKSLHKPVTHAISGTCFCCFTEVMAAIYHSPRVITFKSLFCSRS